MSVGPGLGIPGTVGAPSSHCDVVREDSLPPVLRLGLGYIYHVRVRIEKTGQTVRMASAFADMNGTCSADADRYLRILPQVYK